MQVGMLAVKRIPEVDVPEDPARHENEGEPPVPIDGKEADPYYESSHENVDFTVSRRGAPFPRPNPVNSGRRIKNG